MKSLINELYTVQDRLQKFVPIKFRRNLNVNWGAQLVVIVGARGTGKTTLVLQHLLDNFDKEATHLYFSVDNPLVASKKIFDIGKEFFEVYGDVLIIDEVHKQREWAQDVKALYDMFPNKKMVVLGSSKMNILNQKGDLSRRALVYNLKGLSFREYLSLKYEIHLPVYDLRNILKDHQEISRNALSNSPDLRRHFSEYLQYGFYPLCLNNSFQEYIGLLHNILDKVIYEDTATIKNMMSSTLIVFKKLLAYLAVSTIPTIKVASVCNELDIRKETLYELFDLLQRADLINIVRRRKASLRSLRESRILLLNPNMYYAISTDLWKHSPDLGNIREAFFVSQMELQIYVSQVTDYEIDINGKTISFEIGGRNKSRTQIKGLENAYVLKDDINIGYENVIPLYLAGFLY